MNKRQLIFASLALVLGFLSACDHEIKHPNIVLVLVDDMGYGDPQCYVSNSKIPTPNIDQLALNGLRFTDAHSPASVCTPTRYSILTGRYAWRGNLKKGVLGPYSAPLIEAERLTLPKMLKEIGYTTALIGKWHLGMQWGTNNKEVLPDFWDRKFDQSVIDHTKPITKGPLTAGFDYYFGVDVPNFPPYIFIENDQLVGLPTAAKPDDIYGTPGLMLPGWELEDILPTLTQKAVGFIDDYAAQKTDHPFYLHVTTTSPHTPIVPAKEFIGKSNAGPYGDLVHQTDFTLGKIMNALERNKLTENTIVLFTSDNGSPARAGDPYVHGPDFQPAGSVISKFNHNPNSPWRGMKADIWEGGHRVPFIVSWLDHVPANKTSNEAICAVDIMATIASIVDYQLPPNSAEDSYDLSALIMGEDIGVDAGKEPIREALVHHSSLGVFAVRHGKWKLIPHLGSGGWTQPINQKPEAGKPAGQLYNMQEDPTESNNLWEKHPEVVAQLQTLLEKYKSEGRSVVLKK